jgi:hypothetical protein
LQALPKPLPERPRPMRDLKVPTGPKYREHGGIMGASPALLGAPMSHFRDKGGLGSQSAPNLAQIPQVQQEK